MRSAFATGVANQAASRWWIPLVGIDPSRVKVEHLHAVVSGWLDSDPQTDGGRVRNEERHHRRLKPWCLTPVTGRSGSIGFEIGTLSDVAVGALLQAGSSPRLVRLGGQRGRAGTPQLLRRASWATLAEPSGASRWSLEFQTPTTFRMGSRSTPLPAPSSVLNGLGALWEQFATTPMPAGWRDAIRSVWVSDLDGSSRTFRLSYAKGTEQVTYSGFTGVVTFRTSDDKVAKIVDRLFRLAPYAGVGSQRERGLGVTDLIEIRTERQRRRSDVG